MSAAPRRRRRRHPVGRFFAFLGVTLLCLVIILFGVVWVLERGPSPTVAAMFTRSVRETSAIKWVADIFLTAEEIEQYKSVSTEDQSTEAVNTSLIHIAEGTGKEEEAVQLIDIAEGTAKGKLLIVRDPKRVILGTSENYGSEPGLLMTEMTEKYNALAGINAGGFYDENGSGNGGTPEGLVIANGQLLFGNAGYTYHVVGLDSEGILHVGAMSGQQALDQGIVWAVSFVTYDGLASSLIINGEIQRQNLGGGVNPRTAIGQRDDGAILLLVMDGRSISTLGASMEDVANILLSYGAVNAGNLDGGSSSVMVYEGEIINHCASVVGPRRVPTGFLVLREGAENG